MVEVRPRASPTTAPPQPHPVVGVRQADDQLLEEPAGSRLRQPLLGLLLQVGQQAARISKLHRYCKVLRGEVHLVHLQAAQTASVTGMSKLECPRLSLLQYSLRRSNEVDRRPSTAATGRSDLQASQAALHAWA